MFVSRLRFEIVYLYYFRRIRDNEYEFPTDRVISSAVQHLIQQILTPDPAQRPTLHEIVDHAFFVQGPVPSYIPTSAHDQAPDFRHISKTASDSNLKRLRKYSLLDVDYQSSLPTSSAGATAAATTTSNNLSATSNTTNARTMTTSIAQQEKEFQKAVQPGSPISALLSSARQPLLMGTTTGPGVRESPLLRKLQAVKESPLGRRSVTRGLDGIVEERDTAAPRSRRPVAGVGVPPSSASEGGEHEHEEELENRLRNKELEAQKARIVAQMAPVKEEAEPEDDEDEVEIVEHVPAPPTKKDVARERYRENVAPAPAPAASKYVRSATTRERPLGTTSADKENQAHAAPSGARVNPTRQGYVPAPSAAMAPPPVPPAKLGGFEAAAQTLTLAFDAKVNGRVFRMPQECLPLPDERVFIVSWVDYCNKYGMGYALTDGSVGVHFNDSTTCILSPDKVYVSLLYSSIVPLISFCRHFDYLSSHRQGAVFMRKSYDVENYPVELKSKVYLLKHFEKYIMERLYGEYEYTFSDTDRATGMAWVQKYLRMKHVIVFKLSHDVLQVTIFVFVPWITF